MSNSERLANIIASKLIERGFVKPENNDFKAKLANGSLKDSDWKFLLEDVENIHLDDQLEITESQDIDETE